MKWLAALLALAACGKGDDKAADERTAAAAPVAVAPPPADLKLPVALVQLEAARARPLLDATAFLVVEPNDGVSVGKLVGTLRPDGNAAATTVEKAPAALAILLGETSASSMARAQATLRTLSPGEHVDVIALPDRDARFMALAQITNGLHGRTYAIAVDTGKPALAPFVFAPRSLGGPTTSTIAISAGPDGLVAYGMAIPWGDAAEELRKVIDAKRKASSMTLELELELESSVRFRRVMPLLGVAGELGVTYVTVTPAAMNSPVIPTLGGRTPGVPSVSIGQPVAQGDLDKAIIRRYIKRNIQKIQYCYEKELLARPGLAGAITTKFLITEQGTVRNATAAGVDPTVASCVANVISGIEFPKPKSGSVQVTYPFTFRAGGG